MKEYVIPIILIVAAIIGLLYSYHVSEWFATSVNEAFSVVA
ncbi:Uncharacterised protein [Yersinia bercovieri]|nr:Uncharacterised protein [Yersinia bercovieri]